MKQEQFTLTTEEFIKRSMAGEVFIRGSIEYYYNKDYLPPFRIDGCTMTDSWKRFDGKTLFTLKQPEPIIERRWRWLRNGNGHTDVSSVYCQSASDFTTLKGWYKHPTDFIDVEIQQGTTNEN